jgi:hypothetical protein
MQVGARDEDRMNLPSDVMLPPSPAHPGVLSFDALNGLTMEYVGDLKLQGELLRMLRQAEQAENRGHDNQKERWLGDYAGVLESVRGTQLPAVQTNALILIADSF